MNIKKVLTGKYAKLVVFSATIAIGLPAAFIIGWSATRWLMTWALVNYGVSGGIMATFTPIIFIGLMVLGVLAIREKDNDK